MTTRPDQNVERGPRHAGPGSRGAWSGTLRVVRLTGLTALRPTLLAALLGTSLAVFAARWTPAETDAAYHPATLWLHLAIALTLVAGVAATVDAWPGFGSDQPGRGALLRLRVGPLDGLPAATLGGLLALAPTLAITGAAFELLDARSDDRPLTEAVRPLPAGDRAILHPGQPSLEFELPATASDRPWNRLVLRPRVVVGSRDAVLEACRVTVQVDGQDLAPPLRFTLTGDLGAVAVPPPAIPGAARRLTLRREPGPGVALAFEAEALTALRPAPGSPPWQVLLAAAWAGFLASCAAAIGLGVGAAVAAMGASRGVALAAALVLTALSGPAGPAPHGRVIEALAEDHWIPTVAVAEAVSGSLSIAVLAMLAVGLLRSGRTRIGRARWPRGPGPVAAPPPSHAEVG